MSIRAHGWQRERGWRTRVCFFHQQANSCYQLAWQCFDLTVAHKLNEMGNELTAKAGSFGRRNGRNARRRFMPKGQNHQKMSLLLYGPEGTGKTVLAGALFGS